MWICILEDDFCPPFACVSWLNYDNLFCNILCYVRYLRVHCCLLHAYAWEGSYVLLNMGKFKVLSIYIFCHGAQYIKMWSVCLSWEIDCWAKCLKFWNKCAYEDIYFVFTLFYFYKEKTKQVKQSCSILYSTKMDYTYTSKTSIGFEILFWCRLTAIRLSIIVYHYF